MLRTSSWIFLISLIIHLPFAVFGENNVLEIIKNVMGEPVFQDQIIFYVPSTYNVNWKLDEQYRSTLISGMRRMLTDLSGGTTSLESIGTWNSNSVGIVEENITLIRVSVQLSQHVLEQVKYMTQWLAQMLKQECVMVQVNSLSFFVEP
jgi:hypothetical protein